MKTLKTATTAELIVELTQRDEFNLRHLQDFLIDNEESSKHDPEVLTGYFFKDGSYFEIDTMGDVWLEGEWDEAGDY